MTVIRRIKNIYQPVIVNAASQWRKSLGGVTRIGVTGSVGKTSTKDFIHAVLKTKLSGAVSFSTTNNDYSVARTLIRTRPWHDYCVQEVGASEPGSLGPALNVLRPSIGVLTHIGSDHYSGFRGTEGVAREKSKLISILPADGLAVLNIDDRQIAAIAKETRVQTLTYGRDTSANIRAMNVRSAFPQCLTFDVLNSDVGDEAVHVKTKLYGEHMLYSVLAALAVGTRLGVPLEDGARAIRSVVSEHGRMRYYETSKGICFIDDSFKASYWSLSAIYEFLNAAEAPRKWLVIGSVSDHTVKPAKLARRLIENSGRCADHIVLIGKYTRYMVPENGVNLFETVAAADRFLHSALRPGDLVFVKGIHRRDHLSRLIFSHMREVTCWREDCRLFPPCYTCRHLG
jgi:UDP-N-acetylmuramoyl-tripeptide--D-alanyl-D-alanine ligase